MTHPVIRAVIGAGRSTVLVVALLVVLLLDAVVLVALERPRQGTLAGPVVTGFVGCVRVLMVARALAQLRRDEAGNVAAPVGPLPVGLVALVALAGLPGLLALGFAGLVA